MKVCGDMEVEFGDKATESKMEEEEAYPLQGKVVAEVNGDSSNKDGMLWWYWRQRILGQKQLN